MNNIFNIVESLVKEGIEVTLQWDEDKKAIRYDLNTGMKSHCHLVEVNDTVIAEMRYGKTAIIEDYQDVLSEVKGCMCGRDYLNSSWLTLLLREGLMRSETKTQTTYY